MLAGAVAASNGPQTIGNGRAFWIGFAVVAGARASLYPLVLRSATTSATPPTS